jgi:hypothetical protein
MIDSTRTGSPPEKPLRAGIEKIDDHRAVNVLRDAV